VAPAGQAAGNANPMRSLIIAAYLAALVVHAEWTPLTGLLAAALVAVWAFPLLRRRLGLGAAVHLLPQDVRMANVPGGLGAQVRQDPAHRA
jgi:hypothetical protein